MVYRHSKCSSNCFVCKSQGHLQSVEALSLFNIFCMVLRSCIFRWRWNGSRDFNHNAYAVFFSVVSFDADDWALSPFSFPFIDSVSGSHFKDRFANHLSSSETQGQSVETRTGRKNHGQNRD